MIKQAVRSLVTLIALSAFGTIGQAQQEHVKQDWKPFENRLGIPAFGTPLISPEVHGDRKVTFRLQAPQAREVKLYGPVTTPIGRIREKIPMKKDENGIWSITLGPFPPDIYAYFFEMDGVSMVDPSNTFGIFSNQPAFSELVVHGDGPRYYDVKDVPHGDVTRHIYRSDVVGGLRELYVYTPPCYGGASSTPCSAELVTRVKQPLPVLYLMGGSGETAGNWFEIGRANAIMDNLLAENKANPMLIVCFNNQMTHRSQPKSDDDWIAHSQMVEKELLDHVIPLVESRYSVLESPKGRALAGLSMGGRHAQFVGFRNLSTFGSLGILSAGNRAALDREVEQLSQPGINEKIDYLFVGQGRLENAQRTADFLKGLEELKIDYEYTNQGGQAHDFSTWRWLMYEHFLPGLFRE